MEAQAGNDAEPIQFGLRFEVADDQITLIGVDLPSSVDTPAVRERVMDALTRFAVD